MNDKQPLVYIVLPCYNGGKYLLEQLMSIYYQSYSNRYLIFINDGSNDNSETITRDWISHYNLNEKVKVINKENGGLNSSIQRGLEEVKLLCNVDKSDSLVAYCDADDIWTRDKLNYQISYMNSHPEYGLTYHNGTSIDGNNELINAKYQNHFYREENFFYAATIGNRYNGPTMIYKTKYIDYIIPMPLGKAVAQDFWTALVLLLNDVKLQFLDIRLYSRRIYQGSMQRLHEHKQLIEQGKVRMENYDLLKERFPDKDISYVYNYNNDRYIVRQQKGYGRMKIYLCMLLKYPKIFFKGLKAFLLEHLHLV